MWYVESWGRTWHSRYPWRLAAMLHAALLRLDAPWRRVRVRWYPGYPQEQEGAL